MMVALAEIAERNATGMIAEIYDDIRHSLNVANVNLIYRHFATIEGALPWAWQILRPYFVSGEIERCADQSKDLYILSRPLKIFLPSTELAEHDRTDIGGVLDFYLKTNPMNLFALEILNGEFGAPYQAHWPLLSSEKLSRQAQTLDFGSTAEELMYLVSQGATGVRPTLLRQLARWPNYIESIAGFVRMICVDSRFLIQVDKVHDFARPRVNTMQATASFDLLSDSSEAVRTFCGYFPLPLIRMTIIAEYLRTTLDAPAKI